MLEAGSDACLQQIFRSTPEFILGDAYGISFSYLLPEFILNSIYL